MTVTVHAKMDAVSRELARYRFTASNEAELQDAVASVLRLHAVRAGTGMDVRREVIAAMGRYDILLENQPGLHGDRIQIVLELKVKSSPAAVERQTQKYALTPDVSAVMLVTTSQRLASQVVSGTIGGKPFGVIALRTTF